MEQLGSLAQTKMRSPFGDYELRRYPVRKKETLRAWDSADEYLLQYLEENNLLQTDASVLIINDGFGGLSLPLNKFQPVVILDSYLSIQAIQLNAQNNDIDENSITVIDSLVTPESTLNVRSKIGNHIVLIKVPKSLAMLEDQLHRIRPLLDQSSVIIAAAMTKHIHMSTLELFEKIIGPTKTSRAQKKSRLIFSEFDAGLTVGLSINAILCSRKSRCRYSSSERVSPD